MKVLRAAGIAFVFASSAAGAQPVETHDAAPLASLVAPTSAPRPTSRPDPGPMVRERGARTRRANPASGVLLVFVIVGAMGWYVMKRLRR